MPFIYHCCLFFKWPLAFNTYFHLNKKTYKDTCVISNIFSLFVLDLRCWRCGVHTDLFTRVKTLLSCRMGDVQDYKKQTRWRDPKQSAPHPLLNLTVLFQCAMALSKAIKSKHWKILKPAMLSDISFKHYSHKPVFIVIFLCNVFFLYDRTVWYTSTLQNKKGSALSDVTSFYLLLSQLVKY